MFSSDQTNLKQQWSQTNVINALKQKHLLALAINDLCVQIQQTGLTSASSNDIGLKIEHEAVQHIESLVIDVFISILISSPVNFNNSTNVIVPPEIAYSEAMSTHSSSNLSVSTTISSLNSVDSTASIYSGVSASPSTNSYRSYVSSGTSDSILLPISDLAEAKSRVLQVLPHNYADTACSKALSIVEKCRSFMNSKKRINKLLKTFGELQNITNNYRSNQNNTANNELAQIFKFPIDKIQTILAKRNFDIFVTIFLIYILEFITKDILRLATVYVRCLGKHSISQIDVKTAIQADHALTKIFYSKSASTEDIFDMRDDYDDEDELAIISNDFFESNKRDLFLNESTTKSTSSSNKSTQQTSSSSTTTTTTTNSNEECISDSSTICPETVSIEKLITKYNLKVKELRAEQKQYITDLNILRRIFMYLFRKCSLQFQVTNNCDELIENIFGNINDLYDCALRLVELLDENTVLDFNTKSASSSPSLQQINLIGQQFWELAEGDEFSVYLKYALNVTNYVQVSSGIKMIIKNHEVNAFLKQTSTGLAEISKYLLPKLLIGSIYHFLYLYETIDYLQQMSTDELDKTLLINTLDTLKSTKFKLNDLGFIDSRRRPIETSFRMFHIQQLQQLNETTSQFNDNISANASSSMSSISNSSSISSNYSNVHVPQQHALVSNIYSLTKNKLVEIEKNVESFKLNSSKNQSTVIQILSNLNSSINSGSTNNLNANSSIEVNIKNAYLYEGFIATCKTNQSIQSSQSGNYVSKLINQQKLKVSKRYAYLFDGILILVKRHYNNLLTTSTSKYTSRFKQALSLDKCILRDLDDDCCFELEVCSSNSLVNSSNSNGQSSNQTNKSNQEFIVFLTDSSKDKYQWMSMLCYSQYKFTIDRLLQQMTEEQNEKNPLPIPPENYIFDHPDSPETILYEQSNHHHHQTRYLASDTPMIKAATLVKLIERSTHYLISDQKFLQTFLMCFREFCTPNKLLDMLIQRYNVPDLTNLNESILSKYANDGIIERELIIRYRLEYQQPIRLKVINFIKKWINGYYLDDFANDADLLKRLQEFIEKIGQTNQHYQQQANILQKQIDSFYQRKLKPPSSNQNDTNTLKTSSNSDLSNNSKEDDYNDEYPPYETHLEKENGIYDLFTIHPLEFARQATLMEFEIFKEVRSSELISAGWNKPDRNVLAPNLARLIDLSNDFTYWYAKCIVDTLNIDERVAVMQRILEIAHYFHEMNNFSGLKQIYSAFEISSVRRLDVSRDKADIEQNKMYSVFKKLFDNHEKKYLESIRKCNPPCLPFVGSFLSAIVRTKEYNKVHDEKLKKQILKEQQEQKDAANQTNNPSSSLARSTSLPIDDTTSDNINATFTKSNLINFSKYRLVVGLVVDLLQYQNISYKFRVHEKIRSFILKEFEETYKSCENSYTPNSQENEFETKLRNLISDSLSISSDSNKTNEFFTSRPDRSQIVQEWLFNKSKQIENNGEAFDFPKVKRYAFFKVQPPQSINNNKLNVKLHHKMKLNRPSLNSSIISSDINNNTNKSPSIPRIELKKIKSMPQPPTNSSNLFTAPYLISNLHPNINDIARNAETTINSNYANTVGRITSNVQSSSHSSIGSYIRSSSSFQKQNRSSHKRSNSSVQISKQNKDKLEQPIIEQLKTNTIQSKTVSKPNKLSVIKSNLDFMNNSSHSIGISNASTLSLTSSASALSSSSMFPTSTTTSSSNMQIPFGSIYAVSSSSSSPSPPISLLLQSNTEQEIRQTTKPSLSSSSMSAVLNEKLSLSSADSSSAPNSPPPNYDEVFDSSSTTAMFNFSSTTNSNYSSSMLSSSNCFDNKTYFQRYCTPQQHSSSLSNLKYLPEPLQKHDQSNKVTKIDQPVKSALLSPTYSDHSSSSSLSSSSFAFPPHCDNSFLKSRNKQFSVFSFPDFAEQNEEVELLKKKTSSRTSSIDILTPPPFNVSSIKLINSYADKKNSTFSILTPPPSTPPPPPGQPPQVPQLPTHHTNHLTKSNLSPSLSQISINSTSNIPAPPQYPPPAPPSIYLNENTLVSNTPPPIPARPKKK